MSPDSAPNPPDRVDGSRRRGWLVAAVVLVAVAFRLYMAVATPLIFDEYQWINIVDDVNLRPGEIRLPIHGDQHPPGQVYWGFAGKLLLGGNLLGYRLASVVLGTLTVVLAFRLGALYFGFSAGLLAAWLVATNEYLVGGVSRVCTEKNYLAFAMLAVLLFERVARRPTRSAFVWLGVCFGLGLVTKQTMILWGPLFALELWRRRETRRLWRTPGPWLALAACAAVILPDILYYVFFRTAKGYSLAGVGYQLSKLGLGWDWGPASLYCRSLIFPLVEPALFDYPALTLLPGATLLLGAVASLYVVRTPTARFLQILGFGTFLFFSIFGGSGRDYSAFWWADSSILPFSILTAAAVSRLPTGGRVVAWLLAAVFLVKGVQLTGTRDNVFLPDLARPAESIVEKARYRQRALGISRRHLDHVELCRLGPWWLPAWRYYRDGYEWYRGYLATTAENGGAADVHREDREWVERQLARFPRHGARVTSALN